MDGTVAVTLPGGYWLEGSCHREAELRPVNGSDADYLLSEGELLPAQRVTALLARCLIHLGAPDPVSAEAVRSLTTGDREALLLHLRRLTFGDRLQVVVECPYPSCGEKMDLDLRASDLILPPYDHRQRSYEVEVVNDDSTYRVLFRLPTGGDQEEAAMLARTDPESAAERLLLSCVQDVSVLDGEPPSQGLPPAVAERISDAMLERDQQAELLLSLECPSCGHDFLAPFDAASYLLEELDDRARRLYREVHLLAFYYHWSEAEIVDMPDRKRRLYLELLEGTLAEGAQQ